MLIITIVAIAVIITATILILIYEKPLSSVKRIILIVTEIIVVIFLIMNFFHSTPLLGVIAVMILTSASFAERIYQFYKKKSKHEGYRREIQ